MVAGLAALILSINSNFTATQVTSFITQTALDLGTPGLDNYFGYGRINAYKALSMANGTPVTPQNFAADILYLGYNSHPRLNWTTNSEPDIEGYEVWRKIVKNAIILEDWRVIGTATAGQTQYIDYSINYAGSGPYTAYFKIKAFDAAGLRSGFSSEGSVNYGNAYKETAGTDPTTLTFELHQNYPNPFNPSTQIKYSIPSEGRVTVKIFDVLGREIQTLVNETKTQGNYKVEFNADKFAGGVYIYKLTHGGQTLIRKMSLTK